MAARRLISKVSQSFQCYRIKYSKYVSEFLRGMHLSYKSSEEIQFSKTTLVDSTAVPFPESQFSVAYIKWPPFSQISFPSVYLRLWLNPLHFCNLPNLQRCDQNTNQSCIRLKNHGLGHASTTCHVGARAPPTPATRPTTSFAALVLKASLLQLLSVQASA